MTAIRDIVIGVSAQAMPDPRDEVVAEIRAGLAEYRATGARFQNTIACACWHRRWPSVAAMMKVWPPGVKRQTWPRKQASAMSSPRSIKSKDICCWARTTRRQRKPAICGRSK